MKVIDMNKNMSKDQIKTVKALINERYDHVSLVKCFYNPKGKFANVKITFYGKRKDDGGYIFDL